MVVVLIGFLLGHFVSNATGWGYYGTILFFVIPLLTYHIFHLRSIKIDRWKRIDDIRNPGAPEDGTYFGGVYRGPIGGVRKGTSWSYWPKGYKFGVGHPWYKPKNEEQEEEKNENEKQDITE